ncbi:hypothetical protein [Virgibacillus phasianinus]|nr:hypothetical protein [Virgibacillus phasianinus]
MNADNQYAKLVQEFEQKLNRELTDNEQNFIKWMVNKQSIIEDMENV